jgi:hypothetical protein
MSSFRPPPEGPVTLNVGVNEADLIGNVFGSSSLVATAEVGVRRLPVPTEVIVAVRWRLRYDLHC